MQQKQLSIKHNMIWNSVGSLFNLACQWLITVLIVRLSGNYEDAGLYSLATAVYGIFYPIAQYRMKTYQVSDVSNENSAGEYLTLRYITCAISLVLCMGYAAATCSLDALPAILLLAAYRIATLVIDVFHGCDQQHYRMDYIGQSLAIQGAASLGAFSISYALFRSLELSLFAMTISIVIVGIAFDLPRTKTLTTFKLGISFQKTTKLLLICLPIVVAAMASSAMPSIPRQYLDSILGSEALGAYASVAAPITIIQMGASYIYSPLLTYYSQSFASKQKTLFYRLVIGTVAGVICIGIICSIGIELLGQNILCLVFGESIASYTYLMQPMVLLAVATGFSWFMSELLTALRCFRGVFIGNIVSLAAVLFTVVPFVNNWGMNGATYSCLLATILAIALMTIAISIVLRDHWESGETQ